jgi:PAS domain S-box-containing protein
VSDDKATGPDVEGDGQSAGVPAAGQVAVTAGDPSGGNPKNHWRESVITRPGLDDRSNVFFAAIEMTRMPMILTDPTQDDNPIAFANKAFLDLTGYEESEILGRNCRFLQGSQTDREQVAQLREAIERRESLALEIMNYKRDAMGRRFGTPCSLGRCTTPAATCSTSSQVSWM